jgi:hypothetical protein
MESGVVQLEMGAAQLEIGAAHLEIGEVARKLEVGVAQSLIRKLEIAEVARVSSSRRGSQSRRRTENFAAQSA